MSETSKPADVSNGFANEALAHINRNDLVSAERMLLQALESEPEQALAIQLLGLVRRLQGRPDEAEVLYRRSLSIAPDQPHVHHNLGNLLRSLGRLDEAVAAQREAIRLKPNYVEAHLNLALALSDLGDYEGAAKSCRAALRIQPNLMLARQALAGVLIDLNRPKEAETVARQALALNPRDARQFAVLEHNLAMSLKMQGRYEEAVRLFDSAHAKMPDMPAADYNRANTLQQLGRLEEAAEFYRRAIARDPLDFPAHRQLNHLLYRLGDDEAFLRSYDDTAVLYPELGQLPLEKASFLLLKGDFDSAGEAYARACALEPNSIRAHDGRALILARLGDFDAALREHEIATGIDASDAFAWRNFSETLLRAGDASRALGAAERSLALDPQNQGALAIWGVALRAAGDSREETLNDYENHIRVYEIPSPPGYPDTEAFNRALNTYLDDLHIDRRENIDQTLRKGSQTLGNLFGKDHAIVELLRARIDEAVADYIARMNDSSDHPLFKRKAREFEYAASWSARLFDSGFHTNHVHPKGWISSAYYVALPEAVEKPDADEGWIKFGEPNFECGLKEPVRREVRPRIGTLVLFPSYMWHGTVPFHSAQSRTTIAFDVVPRSGT
jgi:tetratricopeptide (TPR) repeat protein